MKKHDGTDDKCRCCGSNISILHLVSCPVICTDFWDEILQLLEDLGLEPPQDLQTFLLLGKMDTNKAINEAQATIIILAWRCLYAAYVHAKVENIDIDLSQALKRTIYLIISRLKAYGHKWAKWCNKNEGTQNPSTIPLRHRRSALINQEADGSFEINSTISSLYNTIKKKPEQSDDEG